VADVSQLNADERRLAELGYKQELHRSWSGFSNFAISFSIISILAGCFTNFGAGFNNGGPISISWSWPILGVFILIIGFTMSELVSAYPTAGGIYWWSSKLGGPAWGWFTGWFNLVGQIAVTASIGFGCAIFMTSLLNLLWSYPNSYGWIYFTYGLIMLGAGLINMFKVSITATLNAFSAWWHMAGVVIIVASDIDLFIKHHQLAPGSELRHHRLHRLLRSDQGSDAGQLAKGGSAGVAVCHEQGDALGPRRVALTAGQAD